MTFGKAQGAHTFDESVTEDGVLPWQSQPRQRLADATIQEFIQHDDRKNSIYLFLRTRNSGPYTYCGTLGNLSHDSEREMPVHFQWQLMEWPAPPHVLAAAGLTLAAAGDGTSPQQPPAPGPQPGALVDEPAPLGRKPGATKSATFKAVKRAFHPDQDARNKKLGLAGELLVLRELLGAAAPEPVLGQRSEQVRLLEREVVACRVEHAVRPARVAAQRAELVDVADDPVMAPRDDRHVTVEHHLVRLIGEGIARSVGQRVLVPLVAAAARRQGAQHRVDDSSRATAQGTVQMTVQLGGRGVQPARLCGGRLLRGQVALVRADPHARADEQQAAGESGR